jgi:hypothetical protein
VSKDFDTTLSDALDLAANAVQTAGPAAARARGRKRTVRRRIALSTASLVIVAVGASAAFEASSRGGGAPQLTGGSPHATVSPSASPSAGPTQSVVTAPSTTGTTTPTGGATGSSPAGSSAPTSHQSSTPDPHKVLAAAWLAGVQMPFDGTFKWVATTATAQGAPIGEQLTPDVFYVANNNSLQTLTICADPTQLLGRTNGAQHTEYTAPNSAGNNQASQFVFFFSSDTDAQQTYQWLQTQYTSSCLTSGSGVSVTKTASEGATGSVWLTTSSSSGSGGDVPKYAREYFVLRGSTIAYVSVLSYTNALPTSYDDASQLSTIAAHMCAYGGACS